MLKSLSFLQARSLTPCPADHRRRATSLTGFDKISELCVFSCHGGPHRTRCFFGLVSRAAPHLSLRGPFSQTTAAARDTKQNCNFVRRPTSHKQDSGAQVPGRLREGCGRYYTRFIFTINDACFMLHASCFMKHEKIRASWLTLRYACFMPHIHA